MIEAQPTSVFTYEYLIAACEGSDPRILNYVYDQAVCLRLAVFNVLIT